MSNGPMPTGTTGSLSPWAAPYVTGMLGKGQALANQDYTAYTGPLTSGPSAAQEAAFQGVANIAVPTTNMGAYQPQQFTAEAATDYMNPYLMSALNPQIEEARRQSEIQRIVDAGRLTRAGAYGGSRQAIMDSERNRNLLQGIASLTGQGYKDAYDMAQNQFNIEQNRLQSAQSDANRFGLDALAAQANLGAQERAIEQAGLTADLAQFEEERDFPYKQVQYQQSLLQGLPIGAQQTSYQEESGLSKFLGAATGIASIWDLLGFGD